MFESFVIIEDCLIKFVQLGLDLCSIIKEHSILRVFFDRRLKVTKSIFILAELHIALTAIVPVFTNLLWVRSLICSVQLNGHSKIRDGTGKVTLSLINSSLIMICLSEIYKILNRNYFTWVLSNCVFEMGQCNVRVIALRTLARKVPLSLF